MDGYRRYSTDFTALRRLRELPEITSNYGPLSAV